MRGQHSFSEDGVVSHARGIAKQEFSGLFRLSVGDMQEESVTREGSRPVALASCCMYSSNPFT